MDVDKKKLQGPSAMQTELVWMPYTLLLKINKYMIR